MADQTYIGPAEYQNEITDLIERTNRIKVMLWAGDADAARDELEKVRRDYAQLIARALKVKSQVYSNSRREKSAAVLRAAERVRKGWEIDYLSKSDMAKTTALTEQADASLFVLSPVASLITKLDKRVAEETKQDEIFSYITSQLSEGEESSNEGREDTTALEPRRGNEVGESAIVHQRSGFRLFISLRDEGRWEVRGYQLSAPLLNSARLVDHLKELPEALIEKMGDTVDGTWPQRIRGYSGVCHFDLTIFDLSRFILDLVLRQGEEMEKWVEGILTAIAKSQIDESPITDITTH